MPAVVRWTFYDPLVPETYTFEINPKEGGTPVYKRNFAYRTTAAQDGRTIVFEGRDQPQQITWSGIILTEAHLNAYITWYGKKNQIQLTDDLGRTFWIVIESFEPKRTYSRNFWRHEYSVTATIIDWED